MAWAISGTPFANGLVAACGGIGGFFPPLILTTIHGMTDAIGKTPSLLSSGKHDDAFYQSMWESLIDNGYWEGEVWNKRKNGEIYLEWLTITAIQGEAGDVKY